MKAVAETEHGVFEVDLETEEVIDFEADGRLPAPTSVEISLPRVIAAAAAGSMVIAVVDRRPPLLVSHDAGSSWKEAGGGLPAGRAIALAEDDPDTVLYAARNRLYLSRDGGRFWQALAPELPEIRAVELREA
jgi:photosystem II stability/assembly factor-like uncharacterized protein